MDTKARRCKADIRSSVRKLMVFLLVVIIVLSVFDNPAFTSAAETDGAAGTDSASEIKNEDGTAEKSEGEKIAPAFLNEAGEIVYNKVRYTIIKKPSKGKKGKLAAAGPEVKDLKELVIPGTFKYKKRQYKVVRINDQAFEASGITSAVIGKDVTEIGVRAFANCKELKEVTFNNTVSYKIDTAAFYGCGKLAALNWQTDSALLSVGTGAFAFTGLKEVVLPDSCQTIEEAAFYGCTKLTSFCFGEKCKEVGQGAFDGCTRLEISRNKKNRFLLIDQGVVYTVDGRALLSAGGASGEITVHKGVTSIPSYFFEGNKRLTKVILPDSVTEIGECAFKDCSKLKTVVFSDKLTTISRNAFYNCKVLSEINIPASVYKIVLNPFMFCPKLTKLTVAKGNQDYGSINNMLCSKNLMTIIAAPGVGKRVKLHTKARYISMFAFAGNTRMKKIILNKKLKAVGQGAFYGCSSLSYVYIPTRKIDFSAEPWQVDEEEDGIWFCGIFAGCPEGMEINLPFDVQAGALSTIEYYIQQQCNNSAILTQR